MKRNRTGFGASNQKSTFGLVRWLGCSLIVATLATGCAVPFQNSEIASKTSPVTFSGFFIRPDFEITVFYISPTNGDFISIASTTTALEPAFSDEIGNDYYAWSIPGVQIPAAAWQPYGGGLDEARFRIHWPNAFYVIFDDTPESEECRAQYGQNPILWAAYCPHTDPSLDKWTLRLLAPSSP